MKRFVIILVALLFAASFAVAEAPVLKVTGDTSTYVYHDDGTKGAFDVDSNVTLAYWLFKLALNAGYTFTFPSTSAISWGYLFSYAQAIGPLGVYASVGSDSMKVTLPSTFAGNLLDDIKVGADFTPKAPFVANAYALFSMVKGYNHFQGCEVSAAYKPKWGEFRLGMDMLDAQAVKDDTGHSLTPSALEGLSFWAKAKVSY